jgi:hypothetical protein
MAAVSAIPASALVPHLDHVYGSWDRNGPISEIRRLITSQYLNSFAIPETGRNFLSSIRRKSTKTKEHDIWRPPQKQRTKILNR